MEITFTALTSTLTAWTKRRPHLHRPPPSPPSPSPPVINVQPGVNLQTVVDNASPGDKIVLGDGTYTGSGTSAYGNNMLYINKGHNPRAESGSGGPRRPLAGA